MVELREIDINKKQLEILKLSKIIEAETEIYNELLKTYTTECAK